MSSGLPKVSIGLPVYNGERYLALTIDSILAQTFQDFELIISDNCSTDRSREICRQYAEQDSRVRFFPSEVNKGAAWNFRRVFELAQGAYFRWAPSDDVFAPESVAACVEVLDAHPDAVLCYPKTILIDGAGAVISAYEDNLDLRSDDPVDRYRRASNQIGLINVIYGLMRHETLKKTRLIGSSPGADVIFVLQLTLYGKFIEIERPLFLRRMHEGASSHIKSVTALQQYLDPSVRTPSLLRLWSRQWERILTVLPSPLNVQQRSQVLTYLVREMFWCREQYSRELWAFTKSLVRRPPI